VPADGGPAGVPRVDGFVAAFVGDAGRFGTLELGQFLPLGPIDPATRLPISEGGPVTFEEVIPLGPLGAFPDDTRRFWPYSAHEFCFLEIARVGDTIQVVQPKPGTRPHTLDAWLNPLWSEAHPGENLHPILRYLLAHVAMDANLRMIADGHVPYRSLLSEVFTRAAGMNWSVQACYDAECDFASDMLPFLQDLNGRFPVQGCAALSWLAGYAPSQGLGPVQNLVRETHASLFEKLRKEPPHSTATRSRNKAQSKS
jgi:hypothetical protein